VGRRYAAPPLIEAVCELRLTPDTQWDLTIPGMIYEKVKDDFPNREQRLAQEVEIEQGPQGMLDLPRFSGGKKVRQGKLNRGEKNGTETKEVYGRIQA
jgi:hypothetical protein